MLREGLDGKSLKVSREGMVIMASSVLGRLGYFIHLQKFICSLIVFFGDVHAETQDFLVFKVLVIL